MKTIIRHVNVVADGKKSFYGAVVIDENGVINQVFEGDFCYCHEQVNFIEGHDAFLCPGLIDTHCHGGEGKDFNADPKEAIETLSKTFLQDGTTAFVATLRPDEPQKLEALLSEYAALQSNEDAALFAGIHLEGPYLAAKQSGAFEEKWLHEAAEAEFMALLEAGKGKLLSMTVAPEQKGVLPLIQNHHDKINFMIGHTEASCHEADEALKAGAAGFSHLYNAMSGLDHHHPGALTSALKDDKCYGELIVDGYHVDPDVVMATYRMLGPERLILVTDSTAARGLDDGTLTFGTKTCHKEGCRVTDEKSGRLAGSTISLLQAIINTKRITGCSIRDLVQMACVNPARLYHLDHKGSIEKGKDADFILIDKHFRLLATYLKGKEVYRDF